MDRAQICKQDGVHEANGGSVLCGFCRDDGTAAVRVQTLNSQLSQQPSSGSLGLSSMWNEVKEGKT